MEENDGKTKVDHDAQAKTITLCQKNMHWTNEWQNVIFSEENKFNLDGLDCYSCYWHDMSKTSVPRSKRNFGGGSVMVWGAFAYNLKLPICFISTRMSSKMYNELLDDVLVSFLDREHEKQYIFQQNNAAIHVSKESKEWFHQKSITLLDWPACSPDCNPIENLWDILASKVYANGRQFGSVSELKQCIKVCWDEIEPETLKKLTNSMPNTVFEVITNKGSHTKY